MACNGLVVNFHEIKRKRVKSIEMQHLSFRTFEHSLRIWGGRPFSPPLDQTVHCINWGLARDQFMRCGGRWSVRLTRCPGSNIYALAAAASRSKNDTWWMFTAPFYCLSWTGNRNSCKIPLSPAASCPQSMSSTVQSQKCDLLNSPPHNRHLGLSPFSSFLGQTKHQLWVSP